MWPNLRRVSTLPFLLSPGLISQTEKYAPSRVG
ncbi:hypothetical protein OOU_Y34scaffold00516g72 [Pyricularia oryzae Y34]|uniref:Uncharacterized protein n=3 Tax=Pyricularia oryzae TaxID=318829 RepID=A0A4V1C6D9_PYROR|nr:hypothetical protein OOU_Y34scaffold00516g72 [Pyricularia oryzae Y34]QBZ59545.1 hypothetical protein PoMZ_04506 [Pyricularia oryzae]